MASVTVQSTREERDMTIIGNAWINPSKDGRIFINVKINKGVVANIDDTCNFLLQTNPRAKREGKKDPDYMVSLLIPKAVCAA